MVFCNFTGQLEDFNLKHVTILILIDGFLQFEIIVFKQETSNVTILILIDGFLQCDKHEYQS